MARRVVALAGTVITLVAVVLAAHIVLDASTGAGASRAPDALSLQNLGRQARQRAAQVVAAPVLRQVDVDLQTGRTIFMFVDPAATIEVDVDIPARAAADQWQVRSTTFSKLTGLAVPALNLSVLRAGPVLVAQNMSNYWRGCVLGFATLYGKGDDIIWTASCTLPDGGVTTGETDVRTGQFRPSAASPAYPPPTATSS